MKTTRSNFGRKAITFGVVIFVCIALVATGFAAWMISSGSTVQEPGNVDVVTVSNADIKINVNNISGDSTLKVEEIVFAPQEGDHTGYITHTATADNRTENLSFNFSGNVSNGDKVGELTFSVRLEDSIINAAGFFKNGENWTYDAERAYITLPNYAVDKDGNPLPTIKKQEGTENTYVIDTVNTTAPAKITIATETDMTAGVTDKGFTYKLEGSEYVFNGEVKFGWGQVFGFGNPGRTLDSRDDTVYSADSYEVEGLTLPEAELLLRLVNFVNAGKVLDSTYTFGSSNTPVVTSGTVNASDIKLSTLETLANIAGDTKEAKIANLNAALEKAEASITAPKYTIVITAQPK